MEQAQRRGKSSESLNGTPGVPPDSHRGSIVYDGAMPKAKSKAFARIRAEVIRLVGLIPPGKITTYGSIAIHMNVMARHVAFVMSSLTEEESAKLPWHRVVSAEARLSPNMDAALSKVQRRRLKQEGLKISSPGYIQDSDAHFHIVGIRRNIRWADVKDDAINTHARSPD